MSFPGGNYAFLFESTQWPVVKSAGEGDDQAWDCLYRRYARPVYCLLRRKGCSREDAQDLVQILFANLFTSESFSALDPVRGRFRTFLIHCVENLRKDDYKRAQAEKRGGGLTPIPFDLLEAEQELLCEPLNDQTPEQYFDRRWAEAMLEHALERLEREFQTNQTTYRFETLKPLLVEGGEFRTYAEIAASLGKSEQAIKGAVFRARQRLREILTEEIARTLKDPADLQDELRHLFEALSG